VLRGDGGRTAIDKDDVDLEAYQFRGEGREPVRKTVRCPKLDRGLAVVPGWYALVRRALVTLEPEVVDALALSTFQGHGQ
jgi:hypothetical protein